MEKLKQARVKILTRSSPLPRQTPRVYNTLTTIQWLTLNTDNYKEHHILVDSISSVDVLFYDTVVKMNIPLECLKALDAPITRFLEEPVHVEWTIMLPVTARSTPWRSQVHLTFTIVKISSTHNAILGQPEISALRAVLSTYFLLIRFPTSHKVGEVQGNQALAR